MSEESATTLSVDILEEINLCRRHLRFIEMALDTAAMYASRLANEKVEPRLLREAESCLEQAKGQMYAFDYANEAALNLRRAGDVALNGHYD
ncbi:hypothetical protein ACFU44_13945 [Nocardia rhizosphaerihabitans]|uniref:hypothetical protein n=1 Tax=Nocardia rhizosphaerihabitans TaxID=1691570 RepID=UPI00366B3BB6